MLNRALLKLRSVILPCWRIDSTYFVTPFRAPGACLACVEVSIKERHLRHGARSSSPALLAQLLRHTVAQRGLPTSTPGSFLPRSSSLSHNGYGALVGRRGGTGGGKQRTQQAGGFRTQERTLYDLLGTPLYRRTSRPLVVALDGRPRAPPGGGRRPYLALYFPHIYIHIYIYIYMRAAHTHTHIYI